MRLTRRNVLAASGTMLTALAGCSSDSGDTPTSVPTYSGDEYPTVDDWLTETEVGGSDDTYDGVLVDALDRDSVTVDVGAEGNGGNLAFSPSAVVVSPGTTVSWNWTGEGGKHAVVADPGEQLDESDFSFRSGDPTDAEDAAFDYTFESITIKTVALYHCSSHLSDGMKGAVVVQQ